MKTHTVKVTVELFYDIVGMPDYCTAEAAAKMVELAFDNNGTPVSSGHFDTVLGLKPAEICIESVMQL